MRKLYCFIIFFIAINSFSQPSESKFIDESIISFNCESFLIIANPLITVSTNPSPIFQIKGGGFHINISGVIGKNSSSQIMINLYAKEAVDNEIAIIATTDSQKVLFKAAGSGSGIYGGNINSNDTYTINTSVKIISPDQPSYILILPLTVHISRAGNNNFTSCFIDGSIYVYSADKKLERRGRSRNCL